MTTRHAAHMPTRVALRRRSPRARRMLGPPTEFRAAVATDDAAAAERLLADLLALVDAGVVTAITDPASAPRYAVTDNFTNPAA